MEIKSNLMKKFINQIRKDLRINNNKSINNLSAIDKGFKKKCFKILICFLIQKLNNKPGLLLKDKIYIK